MKKTIRRVILCKNCRWFNKFGCAINIVDDSDKPKENDFCSFAELKEAADDRSETQNI